MDEKIKWTNLTQQEIVEDLKVHSITVSVTVVHKLLKKHGYVKRQAQKKRFFLTWYAKLTIKMPRTANIYFCNFQSS